MVRARLFGLAAGRLLVVANVIGLGIFVPGIGVALALGSVLILWAWYVLLGWRLARLARPHAMGARAVTTRLATPTSAH